MISSQEQTQQAIALAEEFLKSVEALHAAELARGADSCAPLALAIQDVLAAGTARKVAPAAIFFAVGYAAGLVLGQFGGEANRQLQQSLGVGLRRGVAQAVELLTPKGRA